MLAVLIGFVPASSAAQQNSTLDSQGNYDNPSLGISFQAPAGWTVSEPKKYQPDAPDVAVIAPYSSGFTASISLSIEKANGTSLDDYVKNKKSQLSNGQSNLVFLSEQDDTTGGVAAKTSLFEENFTSQDGSNTIKFKQSIALANDKFYTLTYANDLKNFDANLANYDQLIGSVKFVSNTISFPSDYTSIGIVVAALVLGIIIAIGRKKRLAKRTQTTK